MKTRIKTNHRNGLVYVYIPGVTDYWGQPYCVAILDPLIRSKGFREALEDAIAYYETVRRDLYDIDGQEDDRLIKALKYLNSLRLQAMAYEYTPETIAG